MYFYATVDVETVTTCTVEAKSKEEAIEILTGHKDGEIREAKFGESNNSMVRTFRLLNIISKDEFDFITSNDEKNFRLMVKPIDNLVIVKNDDLDEYIAKPKKSRSKK